MGTKDPKLTPDGERVGTNHAPGALGSPEMMYPGNPGSSSRLTELAVLADMIGRTDLELEHLLDYYHNQSKHPWVEARLAKLGHPQSST